MAVDFQYHQHEAKQNTFRLVLLFGLGLLAITAVVTLAIVALLFYSGGAFEPIPAIGVALPLTILLVGGASLVKTSQIRSGGGAYVATSLGGRRVDFNTQDPSEKQLCNVVEEMAIASGLPIPAVFVLDDEAGINAFAAGWTPDNAAIGVTRGALTHFNRRELQGVIGHELAHVANGDTRVKTRIIGWIFGISVLAVFGRIILRSTWYAPRRSRNDEGNGSVLVIVAVGVGLLVLGAVGTLFGRLVQAAVSRQREHLADASAVQFTRDPSGLGSALMKIAAAGNQNQIRAAHASETQHLFLTSALRGGFATHPPVKDRIRRLMPDWDGELPTLNVHVDVDLDASSDRSKRGRAATAPAPWSNSILTDMIPGVTKPGAAGTSGFAESGAYSSAQSSAPSFQGPTAHVDYARYLLDQIPEPTQVFLHTRQGAVAAVVGLLASSDSAIRSQQLATAEHLLGLKGDYLDAAAKVVTDLHRSLHMPAVDLALNAIATLPADYKHQLLDALEAMGNNHDETDLFRWMLGRSVVRHIHDQDDYGGSRHRYQLAQLQEQAVLLFAVIAHFNSSGSSQRDAAFATALSESGLGRSGGPRGIPPLETLTFVRLDAALDDLAQLTADGRSDLVRGAWAAVQHDREVSVEEAELVRVTADALRLPMPALLVAK